MKKYSNLKFHLEAAGTPTVKLKFSEMKEILGFALPSSAGKFKNWWSNTRSGQAVAWQEAGYKADAKSLVFEENAGNKKFDDFEITFIRRSRSSFPIGMTMEPVEKTPSVDLTNMNLVADVLLGFNELFDAGHLSKREFEAIKDKAMSYIL